MTTDLANRQNSGFQRNCQPKLAQQPVLSPWHLWKASTTGTSCVWMVKSHQKKGSLVEATMQTPWALTPSWSMTPRSSLLMWWLGWSHCSLIRCSSIVSHISIESIFMGAMFSLRNFEFQEFSLLGCRISTKPDPKAEVGVFFSFASMLTTSSLPMHHHPEVDRMFPIFF